MNSITPVRVENAQSMNSDRPQDRTPKRKKNSPLDTKVNQLSEKLATPSEPVKNISEVTVNIIHQAQNDKSNLNNENPVNLIASVINSKITEKKGEPLSKEQEEIQKLKFHNEIITKANAIILGNATKEKNFSLNAQFEVLTKEKLQILNAHAFEIKKFEIQEEKLTQGLDDANTRLQKAEDLIFSTEEIMNQFTEYFKKNLRISGKGIKYPSVNPELLLNDTQKSITNIANKLKNKDLINEEDLVNTIIDYNSIEEEFDKALLKEVSELQSEFETLRGEVLGSQTSLNNAIKPDTQQFLSKFQDYKKKYLEICNQALELHSKIFERVSKLGEDYTNANRKVPSEETLKTLETLNIASIDFSREMIKSHEKLQSNRSTTKANYESIWLRINRKVTDINSELNTFRATIKAKIEGERSLNSSWFNLFGAAVEFNESEKELLQPVTWAYPLDLTKYAIEKNALALKEEKKSDPMDVEESEQEVQEVSN